MRKVTYNQVGVKAPGRPTRITLRPCCERMFVVLFFCFGFWFVMRGTHVVTSVRAAVEDNISVR